MTFQTFDVILSIIVIPRRTNALGFFSLEDPECVQIHAVACETFVLRFASETLVIARGACEFFGIFNGDTEILHGADALRFVEIENFELFNVAKIAIRHCSIEPFNIALWTIANTKIFINYISVSAMRTVIFFG